MSATITQAERDTSENGQWSNEHGTFHVWNVVIDADGETINATVNRKVKDGASKDPTGEAAEKTNGRWKVAQSKGNSGGGGNSKSPEEQKAIQRQHSQEMSCRAVEIEVTVGLYKPEDSTALAARIKKWTDWFEKDIGYDPAR